MIKLIDFNSAKVDETVYYGGDAGAKEAVVYKGEGWMIKYPKTTRDMKNPQISYTTSPLSEFLGSKIYETLGISVHETLLGIRKNKVVAACKDFARKSDTVPVFGNHAFLIAKQLIPFHDLKNSFMASDVDSYSGTGSETLLDEVLATIVGHEKLKSIPGVLERFWDMFVVDAFIGNNDRNNGNWGILFHPGNKEFTLAPVYDNGNAFFNKRSLVQMSKRINDEKAMQEDAYQTQLCAYKYTGLDNEGHKINPFKYIKSGDNADCNAAVLRFINTVDMNMIEKMINNIPEESGNLAVMPQIQKEFYKELMRIRLDVIRNPSCNL